MEQGAVRSSKSWLSRAGGAAMAVAIAFVFVPAAGSQVPGTGGRVLASATGTVLHADLIKSGGMKLVDANVAFSGAVYDSAGLVKPTFNEMDRKISPIAGTKVAFGRGMGVDAGLAATADKPNQIVLAGLAQAAAPIGGVATKEIGPLDLDPLAWASVLRGRAETADASGDCAIGSDLSSSLGYIADAQLVDMGSATGGASASSAKASSSSAGPTAPLKKVTDAVTPAVQPVRKLLGRVAPAAVPAPSEPAPTTSTKATASKPAAAAAAPPAVHEGLVSPVVALDANDPARAVSQSKSRTRMVGQFAKNGARLGRNFGVMSEVRQTIAPVTLFGGTPNEITLEFLGEWVLQAVATGVPGGAYIHYGPGRVTPSTPILRILDETGVREILTLQQVLGRDGLVVLIPGVAELAIGEDPRAIGGGADTQPAIAGNGTSASAAVDVVRVRVLPGAPAQLTDLRVGHMEVRAQAPEGGVRCGIPVSKTPSVDTAVVGDVFDVDFKVTNPYDCALTDVAIVDAITTKDDARFAVVSAPGATGFEPGASLGSGTITWKLGTLAPHASKRVTARFRARDGAGKILDEATASGAIDDCAEQGATVGGVGVAAVDAVVHGVTPTVDVTVAGAAIVMGSSEDRLIPLTGGPIALLASIGFVLLCLGGAALTLAYRMR